MKIVIPDYIEIELVTGDLKLPWDLTIYKDLPKDEAELIERVKDAEIITANYVDIPASVIDACPNLKYIVVPSVGVEWVDLAYARSKNIAVLNCPTHNSSAVAEHAIGLFFAVQRKYLQSAKQVSDGVWDSRGLTGGELEGKEVVIIGYGNIGKKVAQIATAFGMKVLASNSTEEQKVISDDIQLTDQNSVIAAADILSLHAPLTNQTKYLINKRSLQMMKPDGILINTSRGGLINEFDLSAHLARNPTFFALIDVLSVEPPTDFNALIEHSNCLVTPHIAWASKQARIKLIEGCVDNILAFQNGEPINVVS